MNKLNGQCQPAMTLQYLARKPETKQSGILPWAQDYLDRLHVGKGGFIHDVKYGKWRFINSYNYACNYLLYLMIIIILQ